MYENLLLSYGFANVSVNHMVVSNTKKQGLSLRIPPFYYAEECGEAFQVVVFVILQQMCLSIVYLKLN